MAAGRVDLGAELLDARTMGSHLFASDNAAGVHPRVLAKLCEVNDGHALGYGADVYTARALAVFKEQFGAHSETFFMFNGTAANVLALAGMLRGPEAVCCSELAHILLDECGAPEHYTGSKLIPVPAHQGKVRVEDVHRAVETNRGVVHHAQPRVLSISQATERGTLYSRSELAELTAFARSQNLLTHMDGARIANAAVALGLDFAELTSEFDIVSFGGTKNGLMMADAVVVLNPSLVASYPFIRKQGMQLASKHRYLAAQFLAYFEDDLWRINAQHANRMAAYFEDRIGSCDSTRVLFPVQTNMVFVEIPTRWIESLQRLTPFLVSSRGRNEAGTEDLSQARFVFSFDTTSEEIDGFIREVERLAS